MKHLLWSAIFILCLSMNSLAQNSTEGQLVLQSLKRGAGVGGTTTYRIVSKVESSKVRSSEMRGGLYLPVENFGGKRVPFVFRADDDSLLVSCYWGSAFSKSSGQPEVRSIDKNTLNDWQAQSYVEASLDELVELKAESPISGRYDLQLSGLGEVSFQLTPKHRFLLPAVLAEDAQTAYHPSEAFKISWQRVPGAKAYYVTASGRNSDGEQAFWSSSKNANSWYQLGLNAALRDGTLLGSTQTNVSMPKGLFSGKVKLQIHAVGPMVKGFAAKEMAGYSWPESITEWEVLPR